MSIQSKRDLEIELSKLIQQETNDVSLEQYPTPAHIAADWIWHMALQGEIAGKQILDAGCGNGILGLGLLLMGAGTVFFLDKDEHAIQICQTNYAALASQFHVGKAEFLTEHISLFDHEVDMVVQNPPFGTKTAHADKQFLEKAFLVAPIIYSMHKFSTKSFIEAISRDNGFAISHHWRYEFPIKSSFSFHTKPVKNIDVGLWRMQKE